MKKWMPRLLIAAVLIAVVGYFATARVTTQVNYIGCQEFVTRIGEALRKYHLENNGRYPAALEELTPKYLPYVPTCHSSEKPYEYKVTGKEFLVSCAGPHSGVPAGYPRVDQTGQTVAR